MSGEESGPGKGSSRLDLPRTLGRINRSGGEGANRHPLRLALSAVAVYAGAALAARCVLGPQAPQIAPVDYSQAPTAEQITRGRVYKADFERTVREFVGKRYQQYGLEADPDLGGTDSEEYWARARYKDRVIEFVQAGPISQYPPFRDQSYLVSNHYGTEGRLTESFLATGRISDPEYNINGLPLIQMGILPTPGPDSGRMTQEGFVHIPAEQLPAVTRTVFNLPEDMRLQGIRVCYSFPMGLSVTSTPGLLGRAQLNDGRKVVVRSHEGANATLWVSAPGEKQPDIRSCSEFDRLKMTAQIRWWYAKARMSARLDKLLHPGRRLELSTAQNNQH